MSDDEDVTEPVLGQAWNEHLRWKREAAKEGTYDNSVCTAATAEDWPKCEHCKSETRRVHVEAGRRSQGEEWQEPPFLLDA